METPQSQTTIEEDNSIKTEKTTDTFNRLKDLQTLLKKESALKELCKK